MASTLTDTIKELVAVLERYIEQDAGIEDELTEEAKKIVEDAKRFLK